MRTTVMHINACLFQSSSVGSLNSHYLSCPRILARVLVWTIKENNKSWLLIFCLFRIENGDNGRQINLQSQLDGVQQNQGVYEKIARELNKLGYFRTWLQCRIKKTNTTVQEGKQFLYALLKHQFELLFL